MKFNCTRKSFFWLTLTFVWMTVIFLFSAQNGEDSSDTSEKLLAFLCSLFRLEPSPDLVSLLTVLIRKGAHMTEFGVLALLWRETLRSGLSGAGWNYPVAFAIASAYAATDEFHQLFVSDRAGQVTDWLIDSTGALIFLGSAWLVSRFLRTGEHRRELISPITKCDTQE